MTESRGQEATAFCILKVSRRTLGMVGPERAREIAISHIASLPERVARAQTKLVRDIEKGRKVTTPRFVTKFYERAGSVRVVSMLGSLHAVMLRRGERFNKYSPTVYITPSCG